MGAKDTAEDFGYLTVEEVDFLKELARDLPPNPTIVNIGAGAGTSGLTFREARPDAALYTIDISPDGPLGGLEGERNAFDKTDYDYPIQILGNSREVEWGEPIDLLFIDGDHTEEGIRGDINNFCPYTELVAVHDYEYAKWDEVKPAVDELLADWEVIGKANRIIALRRKR